MAIEDFSLATRAAVDKWHAQLREHRSGQEPSQTDVNCGASFVEVSQAYAHQTASQSQPTAIPTGEAVRMRVYRPDGAKA